MALASRVPGANQPFLNILTLNDGGVRCLSQLSMVEDIMRKIVGPKHRGPLPEPYRYFHLIVGTEWGGVLAIMLGRLRMTIDKCRDWLQKVEYPYQSQVWRTITPDRGHRTMHFTKLFRDLVMNNTDDKTEDTAFHDDRVTDWRPGKTLVLTTNSNRPALPHLFRSYIGKNQIDRERAPIWKVALAAIASPQDIDSVVFSNTAMPYRCIAAGYGGYSNPTLEAVAEARQMWYDRALRIVINLGSGERGDVFEDGDKRDWLDIGGLSTVAKLCIRTVFDTRRTTEEARRTSMTSGFDYVYLSVESGLEKVEYHEWTGEQKQSVEESTVKYLQSPTIQDRICGCSSQLTDLTCVPHLQVQSDQGQARAAMRSQVTSQEGRHDRSLYPTTGHSDTNREFRSRADTKEETPLFDTVYSNSVLASTESGVNFWFNDFAKTRDVFIDVNDNDVEPTKVAVLDTGIDLGHPRFEGRIIHYYDATRDFARDNPTDQVGHGTHVAGIILEIAPKVELCVIRVFENGNITPEACETVAKAVEYATEKLKVEIISMSFAFENPPERLKDSIERASKKTLMFAAASNNGNRPTHRVGYPARGHRVFCVNSADAHGNKSKYNPGPSNHSDNFSILGEDILSTWPGSIHDLYVVDDAHKPGKWKRSSGTSVATPLLAAVCALVIQFGRVNSGLIENIQRMETYEGMRQILLVMARNERTKEGFDNIHPWMVLSADRGNAIIRSHYSVILHTVP